MRLSHFVIAAAVGLSAGALGACAIVEREPGHDNPAGEIVAGAAKGATYGAPAGPWGELIGGALGAIVTAGGIYKVAHSHGKASALAKVAAGAPTLAP